MSRLKTLGFELQSLTAGHEIDGTSGSGFSVSTTTVRSGAAALRCNHAVAASSWLWYQFGTSSPSNKVFYARFYVRLATAPSANTSLIELSDYNSQGTFLSLKYIQSSGALRFEYFDSSNNRVQIGSDSSALSTGTWYRIEIKADLSSFPTSCPVELKIDGASVASGTITDFNNDANHTMIGRFYLGIDAGDWGETATGDVFFDDIAINDGSGSFQNSYPGDGKVIYLVPNASGDANSFATQTGGTAGAANNYTRVDETTPNDATDFNGSSTLNQEDLFNVTNSGIGASDTVNVVEVHGRFRNSTADATAKVTFEVEKTAAGTKTSSSAITPNSTTWRTNKAGGTAPLTAPIVTYQDPDASNWTQSTLDSMQIGYKLTTGPGTAGRRIDVTSVWAVVDYTPAAGGSPQSIPVTGISAASTIGTPAASPGPVNISPSSVVSGLGIGSPLTTPGAVSIIPVGIAASSALGDPSITSLITILATSVPSSAVVGAPSLAPGAVSIDATGITSTSALGSPSITSGSAGIGPSGIPSAIALGTPLLIPGPVVVAPEAILSTSSIGSPSVLPGQFNITPSAITSTVAIGIPGLTPGPVNISPLGISSTITTGSLSLLPGQVTINPDSAVSGALVGTAAVSLASIVPTSIASTASVGLPTISIAVLNWLVAIKAAVLDLLRTTTTARHIYPYEMDAPGGYPAICLTLHDIDGLFMDTTRVWHNVGLMIRIYQERFEVGPAEAERRLTATVDEVIALLERLDYSTLSGALSFTKPPSVRFGYLSVPEADVRMCEIALIGVHTQ